MISRLTKDLNGTAFQHSPHRCCLCNLSLGQPIGGENALPRCHIGLLHIASYASEQGISVHVLDADAMELDDSALYELIVHSRPLLVGFTATKPTIRRVLELASVVKAALPDTWIVLGGQQATFTADQILRESPAVSVIVLGEGEIPFVRLARLAERGQDLRSKGVPGVAFRDGEEFVTTKAISVDDLDRLPWIGPQQHSASGHVALATSRGCYGNCSFCSTPAFNRACRRKRWRARTHQSLCDELSDMSATCSGDRLDIHFHDADFLGNTEAGIQRAISIAEEIIARGLRLNIRLACQARTVSHTGAAFWRLWRRAGLTKVFVGYEAGTKDDLSIYRKASTLKDNIVAYRMLSDAQVPTQAGFIMYNPYSTVQSVRKNLQ